MVTCEHDKFDACLTKVVFFGEIGFVRVGILTRFGVNADDWLAGPGRVGVIAVCGGCVGASEVSKAGNRRPCVWFRDRFLFFI